MTKLDHATNLNIILTILGKDFITDATVSAAKYVIGPGAQYRLADGSFVSIENAVSALSIAVNTGIVFG